MESVLYRGHILIYIYERNKLFYFYLETLPRVMYILLLEFYFHFFLKTSCLFVAWISIVFISYDNLHVILKDTRYSN
jgi:hypothetical protein